MYSYFIHMSLVYNLMSTVCHSHVLQCHPYVTRMWFFHEPEKRARNKATFITTEYQQNVIKLKQNFLIILFNTSPNFLIFHLGIVNFIYACFQRIWKQTGLHWCMTFSLNDKRLLEIYFILARDNPNRNELFYLFVRKGAIFKPEKFVIKSTNKTKRFIWNVFCCASTCLYARINVANPSVIDSGPLRSISFN